MTWRRWIISILCPVPVSLIAARGLIAASQPQLLEIYHALNKMYAWLRLIEHDWLGLMNWDPYFPWSLLTLFLFIVGMPYSAMVLLLANYQGAELALYKSGIIRRCVTFVICLTLGGLTALLFLRLLWLLGILEFMDGLWSTYVGRGIWNGEVQLWISNMGHVVLLGGPCVFFTLMYCRLVASYWRRDGSQ